MFWLSRWRVLSFAPLVKIWACDFHRTQLPMFLAIAFAWSVRKGVTLPLTISRRVLTGVYSWKRLIYQLLTDLSVLFCFAIKHLESSVLYMVEGKSRPTHVAVAMVISPLSYDQAQFLCLDSSSIIRVVAYRDWEIGRAHV